MNILTQKEAKQLSPLTLAFMGDAVYEILVRENVIMRGQMTVEKLHKAAVDMVSAKAQSTSLELIEEILTPDELDIYRRGRNANNNVPRSSSPKDYRRATGFEALFGYLYITGQNDRIESLFEVILNEENSP